MMSVIGTRIYYSYYSLNNSEKTFYPAFVVHEIFSRVERKTDFFSTKIEMGRTVREKCLLVKGVGN